jgi:hypothetical protein
MAIDTRRKRVAAASTRLRFLRRVWIVEPDSTLDASDRARLGGAFQATPQNVALLSLATTSTVHELSVDIPLSVVNTTSTVHSPSVAAVVALNTTNTTSTVHSPSVAVTVALNTVTTSSNVYSHEVVSTVGLESLSTTSTVFSHRVVAVLPGSHMGIELRVLDLAGTVEALLPRYEETAFEDALNEVGSGSLVIAKSDDFLATTVGSELIGAEAKIISVMVDGQERGRWIVEDIQEAFTQDDIPVFVLSGRGLASQLEWGTVIPTTYNPPTNVIADTVDFSATAALSVFKSLFDSANTRGATGILSLGFTDAADSDSVSWTDSQDLEIQSGGNLLSILQNMVTLSQGDWHVRFDGQVNVKLTYGTDLSGSTRLAVGYTIAELERRRSRRNVRNAFYLEGKEGLISATTDATSITNFNRREAYIGSGQAMSSTTRDAYLAASLEIAKDEQSEWSVDVADPTDDGQQPWIDFDLGDTINVYSGEDSIDSDVRILGIAVSQGRDHEFKAELSLQSRLATRSSQLQRAMKNLSGLVEMVDPDIQFPVPVKLDDTIGDIQDIGGTLAGLVEGPISSTTIANDAIESPMIAANAVVASKVAAMNIEAGKYVRSTSYVADTAGWSIEAGGFAEFQNVKVRGDIVGGTIDIGTDAFQVDTSGNMWMGNALFASAPFSVSSTGDLVAASVEITGGTIDIESAAGSEFHVDVQGNMWLGNSTFAGAPFSVSNTGDLTASSVNITGGTISGGTVGSGITASNITTGTLSADRIAANSISVAKLTAGTFGTHIMTLANSASSRIQSNDGTSMIIRGNGTAVFTNISVTGGSVGGSASVDGGIVTSGISATNVTAGTLSANRIAADSIVAEKLGAGTIGTHVLKLSNAAGSRIESNDGTSMVIRGNGTAVFDNVLITGLNGDGIAVGSGNNIFRVNSTGDMWIGHATESSAPFQVDITGALVCSNAEITGGPGGGNVLNINSGKTVISSTGDATFDGQVEITGNYNPGSGVNCNVFLGAISTTEGGEIQIDHGTSGAKTIAIDNWYGGAFGSGNLDWFRIVNHTDTSTPFRISANSEGRYMIWGPGDGSTAAVMQMRNDATAADNALLLTNSDGSIVLANGQLNSNTQHMRIDADGHSYMYNLNTGDTGVVVDIDGTTGELKEDSSSLRFKTSVTDLNGVLAATGKRSRLYSDEMAPKLYRHASQSGGRDSWEAGFIAEDVATAFPELAVFGRDGEVQVFNRKALMAHAIAEIRNLRQELDAIQATLNPGWVPPEIGEPSAEEQQKVEMFRSRMIELGPRPDTDTAGGPELAEWVEAVNGIAEEIRATFPLPDIAEG